MIMLLFISKFHVFDCGGSNCIPVHVLLEGVDAMPKHSWKLMNVFVKTGPNNDKVNKQIIFWKRKPTEN